jgi:hypothetical protein
MFEDGTHKGGDEARAADTAWWGSMVGIPWAPGAH